MRPRHLVALAVSATAPFYAMFNGLFLYYLGLFLITTQLSHLNYVVGLAAVVAVIFATIPLALVMYVANPILTCWTLAQGVATPRPVAIATALVHGLIAAFAIAFGGIDIAAVIVGYGLGYASDATDVIPVWYAMAKTLIMAAYAAVAVYACRAAYRLAKRQPEPCRTASSTSRRTATCPC